ncbi:roadblock/LC7 domain-containing protein [Streptomyces sp. NPDC007856]|uniref:roadblock/LC7 domain-containing protein n=1 Tax=Streptomyces sp. NPDC007856 TaxID=3364781 RepID=UPI003688A80F
MTTSYVAETPAQLNWLLNDMVRNVPDIGHAVLLSTDGLMRGATDHLTRDHAERLAAVASGFHSLAKGTGRHFGGGAVRQTVVEMEAGFLFVCTAGENTVLAALTPDTADIGVVAYEMAMLVKRLRHHLAVDSRSGLPAGAQTVL